MDFVFCVLFSNDRCVYFVCDFFRRSYNAMINNVTKERAGNPGFVQNIFNIKKYIHYEEIVNVFTRNLIFMGFTSFYSMK